jgi:hypothetical protein
LYPIQPYLLKAQKVAASEMTILSEFHRRHLIHRGKARGRSNVVHPAGSLRSIIPCDRECAPKGIREASHASSEEPSYDVHLLAIFSALRDLVDLKDPIEFHRQGPVSCPDNEPPVFLTTLT